MFTGVRKQRGATLGLVITCSLILVLVVVGFFTLEKLQSGSQEVRNAVDAGALNVGKEVCADESAKVSLNGGTESEFQDCLDKSGHVGLNNVNRVIGKAFLVNANVAGMSMDGQSAGDAEQHANAMAQSAQEICNRVTDKLKDKSVTHPFFDDFVTKNSVRMLGANAVVKASNDDWATACVDRDQESNLRLDTNQLPANYNLPADSLKSINEKGGGGGTPTKFFKGYHGVDANNNKFAYVPFVYDEKPHLISGLFFEQGKLPVGDWSKPVPNALNARGVTKNNDLYENSASASVVTNPQRQYQAAIPHAFIRIKLETNKVKYFVNGLPALTNSEDDYEYLPGDSKIEAVVQTIGSGDLHGSAVVGNEFIPPTLRQAVHALSTHDNVNKILLQRCRTMKHDMSSGELDGLLMGQVLIPGIDEYFIFPVYTSGDETNPTMQVGPKVQALAESMWLHSNAKADGSEKEIATETRGPFMSPNTAFAVGIGTGCKVPPPVVTHSGSLKWTPGSGYDQCLGTLKLKRTTRVDFTGACTVL